MMTTSTCDPGCLAALPTVVGKHQWTVLYDLPKSSWAFLSSGCSSAWNVGTDDYTGISNGLSRLKNLSHA